METHGRRGGWSLWLTGLTLVIGGCVMAPDAPMTSATDEVRRATQLMQERAQELAALRADMATTRIAAAKQEAELQELRATVVQLRQENSNSHQALFEVKRTLNARETEMAAIKTERDHLAQTSAESGMHEHQLASLQETVTSLSRALAEVKSTLALAAHKPASSTERHDDTVAMAELGGPSLKQPASLSGPRGDAAERILPVVHIAREEAEPSKPSWITVQPGDSWWSLARKYKTTMNTLRAINGRIGDHLTVGEAIQLP